nr:HAMP domain-containing sensor histidine kinase [uncultured Mucilaginibacter sp.]
MKKSTRYLLVLCVAAVAGVFALQLYWIKNYYKLNKLNLEKEVNLAMEDAVKKEFSVRCDTIQQHIFQTLMDSTNYSLTVKYNEKVKTTIFNVANANNLKEGYSFHSDSLDVQQKGETDLAYRTKLARFFAKHYRNNELEEHSVMYYTQTMGAFVSQQTQKYDFDTARLGPILKTRLAERGIHVPFKFYLRSKDSTFNKSNFAPSLLAAYPVISKAFATYKRSKTDHYIRAMFRDPFPYIARQMALLVAGSVMLLAGVAFSLFYLLRTVFREKKISAIKNDFIANITHEFKTPIATVSAAVEALLSFDVLDDRAKTQRYLTHSKNELARLSALVDKVLNISLYENQQFDIKPEEINVDETIGAILNESTLASQKHANISYVNRSGLSVIYADRLYFQHTMINVIDNAIKYSENHTDIKIECTNRQNHLVIAVSDKGAGISAAHLPYIFEKFYRVPSKRHNIKGHGLGLSYVKSIIEKHKGWCKMESELGKGSTLYLAWPL